MRRWMGMAIAVIVLECAAAAAWAAPQEKKTANPKADAEIAAIRAGSQAFVAAFNKKDAAALAALWAPDGEYVDEAGGKVVGRDAIRKAYAEYFASHPKAEIRVLVDSVRLLGENAAVEEGRTVIEPPPARAPGVSSYTAFHIKLDGKWLMASVRDSWTEESSNYRQLADLEWLIGTWTGEEHGVRTEAKCDWIANKNFVERTYTVTHPNGAVNRGVQIIGWNAQLGRLQSWNFSADGGHAVGLWAPHDGGWAIELHGMTGGGTPTTAVNLIRRLDDHALVWQSVQRSLGDVSLPDTDEVVLKRRSSGR